MVTPHRSRPESRRLLMLSLGLLGLGAAGLATAGTARAEGTAFACRGNEPFWNLQIDGEAALHGRLGEEPQTLAGAATALDYLRPPEVVWRGRGEGETNDVVVMIVEASCQDTMSDSEGQTQFSHQVRVSMPDGQVLVGCCSAGLANAAAHDLPVADLAARPADDWSRYLLDMLPAIEACLDATPGPRQRITDAWPMNHGMVGMRTRNGEGGWFECIAPMIGGEVDRIEAVPAGTLRTPGEEQVIFTRASDGPLKGGCYENLRVIDGGELIGWLAHDVC
jgi:uncharacterized membrane protein